MEKPPTLGPVASLFYLLFVVLSGVVALGSAGAAVLTHELAGELALGLAQLQQLAALEYLLEAVEVLLFHLPFGAFLQEDGAGCCLDFGVGGVGLGVYFALEVACLGVYAVYFIVHLVVEGEEIALLLAGEVELAGEEFVLIVAHLGAETLSVFLAGSLR